MKPLAVLVLALAAVAGRPVSAQTPAPTGAEPAKVGEAKLGEAQLRFQRGIELYKEGDHSAALVEFKRAHRLVPSYKILYNLGQISYQRHDYAGALHYFRQYLGEGDEAIRVERQREVAGDILRLEQRVGRLDVETVEEGAEIFVDDVLRGTSPLNGPILVNGGRRKLDVVARSGEHRTRLVDVAGGEVVRVSFPRLVLQPVINSGTLGGFRASREGLEPAERALPQAIQPTAHAVTLSQGAGPAVSAPRRKSGFPWKSWTLTGLLASGAATTGVVAWLSKRDLDEQFATFPADPVEVDFYSRKTRGFALATDGLLIGTAIMTAISLYLTYRDPG